MLTKIKNSLDESKGRYEQAEESLNLKIGQGKLSSLWNRKKREERLRDLWDAASEPTYTSWESKKEKKEADRMFERIMAENFPNLMKDNNINIQEVWWTLRWI